MKKRYLLSASALLLASAVSFAEGFSVPYSSPVAKAGGIDSDWTVVDANDDGSKWISGTDWNCPEPYIAKYSYHSTNAANDFLISPAIHLESGVEYKVLFGYMTGSYDEIVTLYASTSAELSDILAGEVLTVKDGTFTSYELNTPSFVPENEGDYYFTFHATSLANQYWAGVCAFQVVENTFTPKGVSGLKADVAPNRELKVSLSWTLPTKSIFDDDFTEEQKVEKVEIFRDGEEIAILEGEAVSFDDTEATGLTSGKHTYGVRVTVAGVVSATTEVGPTKYVGPVAPAAVPAEFTISTEEDFNMFTVVRGEGSTTDNSWYYYYGVAQLGTPSGKSSNDWLITPPIAIAEAGYYRVTFRGYLNTSNAYYLEGCVGTSTDVADMKVCASDFTLKSGYASDATDQTFDFYAETPGTYYAALHVQNDVRADAQSYLIMSFKVDFSKRMPETVKNLTATPAADGSLVVAVSWECPEKSLDGAALGSSDYELDVVLDGETVTTLPGGTTEYSLEVESGSHTVSVIAHMAGDPEAAAPDQPVAKTGWVGSKVMKLPYTFDTANPDDTLEMWEFLDANNDGFTWYYFSDYDNAFRFPSTSSPDSFDDYVLSPYFSFVPGTYKVTYWMSGGSAWSEISIPYSVGFAKVGDFTAAGQEWYCKDDRAVMETYRTEFEYEAAIDDAGEYQLVIGCKFDVEGYLASYNLPYLYKVTVESIGTGVENVAAENGVSYVNGMLMFNGVACVEVYDLAGALVAAEAKAEGNYSLEALKGGVYIVRVTAENGAVASLKVAK